MRNFISYLVIAAAAIVLCLSRQVHAATDDGPRWQPYGQLQASRSFENDETLSAVRAFVPIFQSTTALAFINPNLWVNEDGDFSGDVVIGFRTLGDIFPGGEGNGPHDTILGIYSFVGRGANEFNRVGLGAEIMTAHLDLATNVQLPISSKKLIPALGTSGPDQQAVDLGNGFFVTDEDGDGAFHDLRFFVPGELRDGYEKGLVGLDFEGGFRLFFNDDPRGMDFVRVYGGGGYFFGDEKDDPFRAHVGLEFQTQLEEVFAVPVELVAGYRYDWLEDFADGRENSSTIYAQLRIPLGQDGPSQVHTWRKLDRLQSRMDRLPNLGNLATEIVDPVVEPGELIPVFDPWDLDNLASPNAPTQIVSSYYLANATGGGTGEPFNPTTFAAAVENAGNYGLIVVDGARGPVLVNGAALMRGQNILGGGSSYRFLLGNGKSVTFRANGTRPTLTGGGAATANADPEVVILAAANEAHIRGVHFTQANVGVEVGASSHFRIDQSSFSSIGADTRTDLSLTDAAIRIDGGNDIEIVDVAMNNIFAHGVFAENIAATGNLNLPDGQLLNPSACAENQVDCALEIRNLSINGITGNNSLSQFSPDGIHLENVSHVLIESPDIRNILNAATPSGANDSNGIQIDGPSDHVTIFGGTISNISGRLADGIDIQGPWHDTLIDGISISRIVGGNVNSPPSRTYGIRMQSDVRSGPAEYTAVIQNVDLNIDPNGENPNGPNDAVNFRGRRHDVSGTGNTASNYTELCRYTAGAATALNDIDVVFDSTDAGPATCTDTGVVP